ncbi:MAG: hypothetical protein GX443_16695 [Deltaproteobacteria bacterium]|nr:hypothetical protein [Deltaproteobacteria bacterium]
MTVAADPDLLDFSVQLLERWGGLIERQSGCLLALLPPFLAGQVELPEEIRLGSQMALLIYGGIGVGGNPEEHGDRCPGSLCIVGHSLSLSFPAWRSPLPFPAAGGEGDYRSYAPRRNAGPGKPVGFRPKHAASPQAGCAQHPGIPPGAPV